MRTACAIALSLILVGASCAPAQPKCNASKLHALAERIASSSTDDAVTFVAPELHQACPSAIPKTVLARYQVMAGGGALESPTPTKEEAQDSDNRADIDWQKAQMQKLCVDYAAALQGELPKNSKEARIAVYEHCKLSEFQVQTPQETRVSPASAWTWAVYQSLRDQSMSSEDAATIARTLAKIDRM